MGCGKCSEGFGGDNPLLTRHAISLSGLEPSVLFLFPLPPLLEGEKLLLIHNPGGDTPKSTQGLIGGSFIQAMPSSSSIFTISSSGCNFLTS
jgi:hypothetical protein